ncbi:MAG: hypothetical protein V1799_16510 [bacterium]
MVTILLFEALIAGWILMRQERRHAMEERYYLKQLGMPDPSPKPTLLVFESWLTVTTGAALFVGGVWLLSIFLPHLGKFMKMPHGAISLFMPILLVAVGFALLFLGIKSLLTHKKVREESFSHVERYP